MLNLYVLSSCVKSASDLHHTAGAVDGDNSRSRSLYILNLVFKNGRRNFRIEHTVGTAETTAVIVFFHLYKLAERWEVAPEDVLHIMYDLEQNGLIKYSLSENEFAIEPCITTFTSTDAVVHKGNNCDTPLDELCFEMMTKRQISEAITRNDSLITLHFPMITLRAFTLKKDENENANESVYGVVLNP